MAEVGLFLGSTYGFSCTEVGPMHTTTGPMLGSISLETEIMLILSPYYGGLGDTEISLPSVDLFCIPRILLPAALVLMFPL